MNEIILRDCNSKVIEVHGDNPKETLIEFIKLMKEVYQIALDEIAYETLKEIFGDEK